MRRGKRALWCWLVAVSLVLAAAGGAGAEVKVTDVPKDHWAYQAVVSLVEKGYLGLYEGDTFQGQRPADRYTLASVVAKLLAEVERGSTAFSEEDLKALRRLSTEFRTELVALGTRADELNDQLVQAKKELLILQEDITKGVAQSNQLQARLEELEKKIQSAIAAERQSSQVRIKALEDNLASLQTEYASYRRSTEERIAALEHSNRVLIGGVAVAAVIALLSLNK